MIEYKVLNEVYNDIVTKKKDTEIRLLNEKSSSIKIGDTIKFKVLDNEDIFVDTKVINLKIYNNVEEIWDEYQNKNLLSTINSLDEFKNVMYSIFTKEKVDRSKIIGIQFKMLKKAKKVFI